MARISYFAIFVLFPALAATTICWATINNPDNQWCISTNSTKVLKVGQGNCTLGGGIQNGFEVNVIYNGMDNDGVGSPKETTACCTGGAFGGFCISSADKHPLADPPFVYEVTFIGS